MYSYLRGKKIWIHALGCRTNQYESEALASMLFLKGAEIITNPSGIDAAIILSCTVTATADRKCRQLSRKIKRLSPGCILVVCGCWAQRISESESRSLGIDILIGSRNKSCIPEMLERYLKHGSKLEYSLERRGIMENDQWDPLFLEKPLLHTRAFVKVQDGCNHFCSYCIIPYVRGYPVSRDPDDIISEVSHVVSAGCHEVVLTGVHLGLYEKYGSISLGDLVKKLSCISGLWRIRFGSLEPFALSEGLLMALSETPEFCRHLHLPLQSGDDSVLSLMKRGYTGEDYLRMVDRVRYHLGEDVHISTDILVGFPSEDDKAFHNTLDLVDKADFGKLHVFPFSPREGTPAFEMGPSVPSKVISERVHEVLESGEKSLARYCKRWIGRPVELLLEKKEGSSIEGLTREFIRVQALGDSEVNNIVKVIPRSISPGGLKADILTPPSDEDIF